MHDPAAGVVAAAAGGDPAAFAAIVHHYREPLHRYLTRLLDDAALAEDVTQEALVRIHRDLARFAGRARFSTWVFAIAHNVGIDAIRYRQRRPLVVGPVPESVPVPTPPGLATEIGLALQSLAEHHREPLLLVEVVGLSYREVAEILCLAEGTVKSRVHHARRLLHRWLQPSEAVDGL